MVGKELPLEELKDRISMLGTDLEDIKDNEIHVEVFPNRPDMLSEQGFARAFSSFIGVKTGLRKYAVKESNQKIIIDSSVKGIRPYTACAIVKGLQFDEENLRQVIQIQEKLHVTYGRNRKKAAIGIYPMEKITFPITYRADSPNKIKFRPLESDREMSALEILEEHKAGKEYAHLLQRLAKYPIFVDAKGEILSMPPIINSDKTGRVTDETKDVFVECSGFDFEVLSTCLNMIVTALADMGGEIYSLKLEYSEGTKTTPNLTPSKMKLDLPYVNKRLGLSLSEKDAIKLLEKMGYGFEQGHVLIPAYRADILHQVDLIEDIAIAYGYNNLIPEIPSIATAGEISKTESIKHKISEMLCNLNMLELSTLHILTKEDAKKFNVINPIEVEDSKTEYKILRPNLTISTLKTLSQNIDSEYPQRVFELGRVFKINEKEESGIEEAEHLSIAIASPNAGFTEIKQILEYILRMSGKSISVIENTENHFYIEGRCGKIILEGQSIGFLGEIRPSLINSLGIKMPIAALEINIDKVVN